MRGRGSGGLNGARGGGGGGGVREEGRGYVSDGKRKMERERGRGRDWGGVKVEVANLVPCCISPSHSW